VHGTPASSWRRPLVLAVVALSISTVVACAPDAATPVSSAEREQLARGLLDGLHVSVELRQTSLVAAGAPADLGIEQGMRWVTIRVVDGMALDLVLDAEHDIALAEPPYLCLVGPFWNPLDAGLSDRCWGNPDLAAVLLGQLPTDDDGHPYLPAQPMTVAAVLERGAERCDYAPGSWSLELAVNPFVAEGPAGRTRLSDVVFDVPSATPGALLLLPPDDTRVCSYPAAVWERQGEPPLQVP